MITPSSDAFAAVAGLIALITDAPACKARLFELQKLETEVVLAQGKLAADRERHAAEVAKAKAELAEREKLLRAREVALAGREGLLHHREGLVDRWKAQHDRQDADLPPDSSLRREWARATP
jgi:uncharacterized membrane protein YccC